MSSFLDFSRSILLAEEEQATLRFWQEADIFGKSLEARAGAPRFVFYEGPPTANGRPGIHHVLGRTIKDLFCRYRQMKGCLVERKSGWDTHGLPVELEVEKKLGIHGKEQIEAYGLEKFNQMCRDSVFTYKDEWERITARIGFWLDLEHPYVTLENDYIESVWWCLRQFWEKGYVYEGFKILPYCPRCETPLSSHEVSQGYAETEDPSVYVKFQSADDPNLYYLAWTTTPWTLISNVALAVRGNQPYVRVRLLPRLNKDGTPKADTGHAAGQELILAQARLGALYGPYEVLAEFPGAELMEKRYVPLFPFFSDRENGFRVLTADYVTMEDGTGVVHTAPAFGEDDYRLGQLHGLPAVRPVGRSGEFTEDITPWAGVFVKTADPSIIESLKQSGHLYTAGTMTHSYPFCWRCDSPLIYYARDSWYLKTTAFRERMVAANASVRWLPPEAGEKRFGDWLKNNIDWGISRDRYWGTPLPIWRCDACGVTDLVAGRAELRKRGAEVPDDLELHRPWIDRITFPCAACAGGTGPQGSDAAGVAGSGGTMRRVPEVVDVWFDSGAMPFAQWHYPFENQGTFQQWFPASFISEGIDQTRGWFYSLLAISTAIMDRAPYQTVVVNDLVLDATGQKMSKHKGNTVNPWDILDKEGADAARWYLMINSPPWLPTRFAREGVTEVARKFLATLRNVASFFAVYANLDGWTPAAASPPPVAERPLIDRWLLSRLDGLTAQVDQWLDAYDPTRAVRALQDYVLEELSNWYVRRNRRRFWKGERGADKESAYATLHEALTTVARLVAPFTPFVAEELHQKLVRAVDPTAPLSVHLTDFPVAPAGRRDEALEARMATILQLVEAGRSARNGSNLKVRQPLATLFVSGGGVEVAQAVADLGDVIQDELNVRAIELVEMQRLYDIELKPHFKALGPVFGKAVNRAAEAIRQLPAQAALQLAAGQPIHLAFDGHEAEVTPAMVEILRNPRPGLAVVEQGGVAVGLSTELTPELVAEGRARELVHRLQNLRKERGLAVTDRIHLQYRASSDLADAVRLHSRFIQGETLAETLAEGDPGIPESADPGSIRSDPESGVVVGGNVVVWDIDGQEFAVSLRLAESVRA